MNESVGKKKKLQEMKIIEKNKKKEQDEKEEKNEKNEIRRGGGSGSDKGTDVTLTKQQKKEMESIIQQRKEYETKHREIRFEREKVTVRNV